MALNYDISIQTIDENGNNVPNAKIHAYFYKVDSASSPSTWDNSIRLTAGNGKTALNLGDLSYLTSEGLIKTGDKVLLTAWLTNNTDTNNDDKSSMESGTISRCVNIIHTVDTSSSSWFEVVTLLEVQRPICNISIPTVTHTGHSFTIGNTSIISEGAFSANGRDDLYQELSHYSQDLFLGRAIKETVYDLGENISTLPTTTNKTYSYIDAGDWHQNIKVYNHLGFYCFVEDDQHILYNKPSINFDYTFNKLLNTDKHIGVGNDDLLNTIQQSSTNYGDTWSQLGATFDWRLSDLTLTGADNSDEYLAQNESFEPSRYYLSEGSKTITLKINWNDGFEDHVEELSKYPFLDIYNINLDFNWSTEKNYVDSYPVPLGDDDLVTVYNLDKDSATQNYNSLEQWKEVEWNVTKNKNDGTDDSERFIFNSGTDNISDEPTFYIRYLHSAPDLASIEQTLTYWDGYKDVEKSLLKELRTQNYTINHAFHWVTDLYGTNKVVTMDTDSVELVNDTTFSPQNEAVIYSSEYWVTKDKYTSYTDYTVLDDSEYFNGELSDNWNFFIRKEGDYSIKNTISYYDGYKDDSSDLTKIIQARVCTPNPKFTWDSRYGNETFIEGRDDLVTFSQSSTISDYYGTEYSKSSSRNLNIDWSIWNYITTNNYNNPNVIGGPVYTENSTNLMTFTDKELTFKPLINYWSAKASQNVNMNFYYNDGFFNRDIDLMKQIETRYYTDLIPGANYTANIPDRHTNVIFSDNSTNNEERIISEDWSLTDRYSDISMSTDKRDTDNLQTWFDINRETEITTKVNSNENHTLSQDEIRWDNGFNLQLFSNSYNITTTEYDINVDFNYWQKYVTGPEIVFDSTSTPNDGAVLLAYDLDISDKDNDGNDTSVEYFDIVVNAYQEHTYKSVSNSPFESDKYNKPVTITEWYDNGWDEVYDTSTSNILVKPNRISQDFLTNPIRHPEDTETSDFVITGNNPIEFYDNSTTERLVDGELDYSFIQNVEYKIIDSCL